MRPPFKKFLQTSAVMSGALALVLSSAGVAGATEGDPAAVSPGNSGADLVVVADNESCTVTVTSDKVISNVKLYADGSMIQELEDPSGNVFDATGATEVSAKSGTTEKFVSIDCGTVEADEELLTEQTGDDGKSTDDEGNDDVEVDEDAVKGTSPATVVLECVDGDLVVTTSKDLSNVKFFDAEGNMVQELEGLSGFDNSFPVPADAVKATAKSATTQAELVLDAAACDALIVPEQTGDDGKSTDEEGNDDDVEAGAEMVTICRATGSAPNPFVVITVSTNAILEGGHGGHEGDIIPAFDGFEGQNLDQLDLIDAGCVLVNVVTVPGDIGLDDDDDLKDNELMDDGQVLNDDDDVGVGPVLNSPVLNSPVDNVTPDADTPEVLGDVVLNPVTPIIPATPAVAGTPAVSPAIPAVPATPAVLTSTGSPAPQVLGSQVTRSTGALAATGDSTTDLVPFGLGLLLLGYGIQRTSKRLGAARIG